MVKDFFIKLLCKQYNIFIITGLFANALLLQSQIYLGLCNKVAKFNDFSLNV